MLEYLFIPGGAHKANRLIMEGMAGLGHECYVISGGGEPGARGIEIALEKIKALGLTAQIIGDNVARFTCAGVNVIVATDAFHFFQIIRQQVDSLEPDVVIVSEDNSFLMLKGVLDAKARRIVYLAHSQATLPFGPASFTPCPQKTATFERADGIIAVSKYVADYIDTYSNQKAQVIYSPVYGKPPHPFFGSPTRGFVTMINPSKIKGIQLFLAVVAANPHMDFAVVPTWATTAGDRRDLENAGVKIIPPDDQIDHIFSQVKVLLVPSLWGEAFGQIVVEAMLRGIPVLASNLGGLPEAKLAIDFLLPVNEVTEYEDSLDERKVQVPKVPLQDPGPWIQALRHLHEDRSFYRQLARDSCAAAHEFVAARDFRHYETFLTRVLAQPSRAGNDESLAKREKRAALLKTLNSQQRALILKRLQDKNSSL